MVRNLYDSVHDGYTGKSWGELESFEKLTLYDIAKNTKHRGIPVINPQPSLEEKILVAPELLSQATDYATSLKSNLRKH